MPYADYSSTIPHQAFMVFQMMFAVITPALMTGAFADRMKFRTFLLFSLLWATLIYDPLAHWVWGVGGWIRNLGAIDFAGGTVVHISSGVSALVAVLLIGKRNGHGNGRCRHTTFRLRSLAPVCFGWAGLDSTPAALAANGLATSAFVVTNTAAAAATLTWMLAEWVVRGKPTMLGAASGAVAGLVAITPGSGYVSPMSAIIIGGAAGVICYSACLMKLKMGYDDALDVVGVHGAGGIFGALATGLFASKAINPAGADGLFNGNPGLFVNQILAVGATVAFAAIGTAAILVVRTQWVFESARMTNNWEWI